MDGIATAAARIVTRSIYRPPPQNIWSGDAYTQRFGMIWIQHEGHFQELVEVKIYTPTSLMLMPPYMTQGSFSAVPQRPDMYVEYIYIIIYIALFSYGYAIE